MALLAELPALPLHEAGKYVAGAYVVLFALVLVYVAIMAIRQSRIERELGELLAARAGPRRTSVLSGELLALGISHKTAPVALRERLAFDRAGGDRVRAPGDGDAGGARGGRDLDVQPHRGLPRRRRPGARRVRRARAARRSCLDPPDRALGRDLLAAQLRRGAPALSRDGGARVDDRRRGRDPGPGQALLRSGDARRVHGTALQSPVRGGADGGQARAHGDRDRRHAREHPLGGGRPRAERARRPRAPSRGRARRGRDERAYGARAGRAGCGHDLRGQPPRRPSAQPGAALRRQRGRARRPARATAASRHRAVLDLLAASDRRPRRAGDGDARARRAPAAVDRHRRATRRRGCVRRARGRQPVRHRRPAGGRRAQHLHARGRAATRGGDRRGGDPPLRPLARPARRRCRR